MLVQEQGWTRGLMTITEETPRDETARSLKPKTQPKVRTVTGKMGGRRFYVKSVSYCKQCASQVPSIQKQQKPDSDNESISSGHRNGSCF